MTNRLGHLSGEGEEDDPPELELPDGFDPQRLPPQEPNRNLPLEIGIERDVLIGLLERNLQRLQVLGPQVDAEGGNTDDLVSETVAIEIGLKALLAWAQQHPGPLILMAMYPTPEIETIGEDDEG